MNAEGAPPIRAALLRYKYLYLRLSVYPLSAERAVIAAGKDMWKYPAAARAVPAQDIRNACKRRAYQHGPDNEGVPYLLKYQPDAKNQDKYHQHMLPPA